ncbi:MAG: U32 family peptidase, partial [Candidatus Omnitrophica bacterium]|nr:U32 family peptidase [Candidatus Omnitrophota bacterium]
VNTAEWKKRMVFPNARHMFYGNLNSFEELGSALRKARDKGVTVYLCLNDYLSDGAFQLAVNDISRAISLGVDGFIISDINLIPYIKKLDNLPKIVLSSLTPCFNYAALKFYKKLGVDRVVLPPAQLSLREIERLSAEAKEIKIDLEVFINNANCKNINGYCLFHSLDYKPFLKDYYRCRYDLILATLKKMVSLFPEWLKHRIGRILWSSRRIFKLPCRRAYSIEVFKKSSGCYVNDKKIKTVESEGHFSSHACILCSVYYFIKFGIAAGKICGRGSLTRDKIKDIKFMDLFMKSIKNGVISETNLSEYGRRYYSSIYGLNCHNKFCFHISVGKNGVF